MTPAASHRTPPEVDDAPTEDVDDLFRQLAEARAARMAAEDDLAAERARQAAETEDATRAATTAVRTITGTRAAIADAHALTVRALAAHVLALARRALVRHGLPATEPDALALLAAAPDATRDGLKVDRWGRAWVHEPGADHALDTAARQLAAATRR